MYTSNSTDRSQDSRGDRTMGYVARGSNHSSFNYVVIMESSCAFLPVTEIVTHIAYYATDVSTTVKIVKSPRRFSFAFTRNSVEKKEEKWTIRFVNRKAAILGRI